MRRGPQRLLRLAPMKIEISIPRQTLELRDGKRKVVKTYSVSTAKKGPGEKNGSLQTPRGRHIVRAKIGTGQPLNAVFVRRRPTGEVWSPELHGKFPGRDWILTRILWLSGCEPGKNRLGDVDTMRRYIYIHGSPDSAEMGKAGSIGCIRMRNADIVELFDLVAPYTPVEIHA
jgi:lipoprotein-anchoring transpeptidase ErfK/SrfK